MDSNINSSSYLAEGYYEPLIASIDGRLDGGEELDGLKNAVCIRPFSWLEYFSFFTIGMSMMWTWSMILQAVPYFHRRFRANSSILRYFQATFLVFFAFTMMALTLILGVQRKQPAYAAHLKAALWTYVVVATLLMCSTMSNVTAELYFPFTLVMVIATAFANGLSQNAAFAFAAGFGRTEYSPAIMTGEALAALLPSTIEIASALIFPSAYFDVDTRTPQTSILTLGYFLSAVLVGIASLSALLHLVNKNQSRSIRAKNSKMRNWTLISSKLLWPALANFLCLCISSVSPVFASKITSLVPVKEAPTLLKPEAFIPLAIVLWNIGDLLGSILAVSSRFLIPRPGVLFMLSLARVGFIPLYLMCNIDSRGSVADDWFYLIIVQFSFGLTHGWLSGASIMGVPAWVEEEEREEAGAFMGMTLVTGLVVGSMVGLAAAQA